MAYDISSRLAEIEARRRSMQLDLQTDLVASARAGMPSKRPFAAVPLEPNALSGSARAGMPSKRPFAAVPLEPNALSGSARAGMPSKRPFAEAASNADALWVDPDAAKEWVLPAQPAARPYQVDMAKSALFSNTLVCLPTGLGKTMIASIVMANFLRWFPRGIVIFAAPTRPLVAQQIEACRKVMGIPEDRTIELNGGKAVSEREVVWQKGGTVFFATPQTIENDIVRGICPKERIVLVIYDECHRAVGKHAYAVVAKHLSRHNVVHRCIGLSATPGGDRARLQEVCTNLSIARIEFRAETDAAIKKYVHHRDIATRVVRVNAKVERCCIALDRIISDYLKSLCSRGLFWTSEVAKTSKTDVMQAMQAFRAPRQDAASAYIWMQQQSKQARDEIMSADRKFESLIPLFSLRDQLQQFGVAQADSYINIEMKKSSRTVIQRLHMNDSHFRSFARDLSLLALERADDPKMAILKETLTDHFAQNDTRVIVFTNLRWAPFHFLSLPLPSFLSFPSLPFPFFVFADTHHTPFLSILPSLSFPSLSPSREQVHEIVGMLKSDGGEACGIKPAAFIGQARGKGKCSGMNQKAQKEVLCTFRSGSINTLVATCVAEEGLDVPQVGLIVCYEPTVSPGRNIQRTGRTGRQQKGRIVYLLLQGKEQNDFKVSESSTHARIDLIDPEMI